MNQQPVKYFHQLSPPPLSLDEIAINIRQYLTVTELRKCMLVSVAWSRCFRRFLWESVSYNRIEARQGPSFTRNAHCIRTLYTYCLDDADLERIACFCHNLLRASLEIRSLQDAQKFTPLLRQMSNLQYLVFKPPRTHHLVLPQDMLLKCLGKGNLPYLRELYLSAEAVIEIQAPCYSPKLLKFALLGCTSLEVLDIHLARLVTSPDQIPEMPKLRNNIRTIEPFQWLNFLIPFAGRATNTPVHHEPGNDSNAKEEEDKTPAPVYPSQFFKCTIPPKSQQCLRLRRIRLSRLVADRSRHIIDFNRMLLKLCPNLQRLTLESTEIELNDFATLCPKLQSISLTGYNFGKFHVAESQIYDLWTNPPPELQEIRINGLPKTFNSRQLVQLHQDITRYHLTSLFISDCLQVSWIGLGKLINQCWQLKTLHVELASVVDSNDDLTELKLQLGRTLISDIPTEMSGGVLPTHSIYSAQSSSARDSTSPRINLGMSPRHLRWGCPQLRYLDVTSCRVQEETFFSVVCDLLESLDHQLEYLGLPSHVIPWLVKERPIRFLEMPDSETSPEEDDFTIMTSTLLSHYPSDQASRPRFPVMTLPLGMFGAIKTLSIEVMDRKGRRNAYPFSVFYPREKVLTMEWVQYIYCAFPAMEKMVYNAAQFPVEPHARDWLLNTPRKIPVEYWSKKQLDVESGTNLS